MTVEEPQAPPLIYELGSTSEVPAVEIIGGKARNLFLMMINDIPVPDLLVLSVPFFEAFIGEDIKDIDKLLSSASEIRDNMDEILESLADNIRQRILNKAFTAHYQNLIRKNIAKKFGETEQLFLAVRSSAVDEDSLTKSFAGQLESFLFVQTNESLFNYIKLCFASAFSYRCLKYRLENNLPVDKVRPAVIIQKMVFSEVSGVLFTGNPLTNNPEEMVINACYGVGEGIVSGAVDSDLWVLDEKYSIKTAKIAHKNEIVVFDNDAGQGLTTVTVDAHPANAASLSTDNVQQLAEIGKRIEDYFGGVPQDIEWALEAKRVYILQSRPVSTMGHISKHLPCTILDNSNIIESYSGVTSPLTFSFASCVYNKVFQQFYSVMGIPRSRIQALSSTFQNILAFYNGRIYYNLTSRYKILSLLPGYKLNKSNLDLSIGVKTTSHVEKFSSTSKLGKVLYDLPVATWSVARICYFYLQRNRICNKFLANFERIASNYLHEDFSGYSNIELLKFYDYLERELLKRWTAPIINDFFTETFYGLLTKLTNSLGFEDDAMGIQNDLLCGQGEVESVKPTQELIAIANWIRPQESLRQLILDKPEAELIEIISSASEGELYALRLKLDIYIKLFGYRCINELKMEEKTLKDDPAFIFQMLKTSLSADSFDFESVSAREQRIRQQAEYKIIQRLSNQKLKLKLLNWVIKNARERVKVREELRLYRAKVFSIIRNLFNAIGKNLTKSGLIHNPADIYYLTVSEIFEMIESRSVNAGFTQELIKLRKQQAEKDKTKSSPERIHIYGDLDQKNYICVISDEEARISKWDEKANVFTGVGCSPGQVEGTVKIVLKLENAQLNGEILVTKRTDPGWVPIFPYIRGLVIERGSVLSHSAVVAREMGIPTVVGLRGITDVLQDCETIILDGSRGTVTRKPKN